MIMMRTPGSAPAGRGPDPGRRRGGVRIAGFSIRFTGGAYILAMLAVVVSALSLGAAAPGWPASAYAAATAGVVVALLASMTGHELAHAAAARRHGAGPGEIWVGFFGGTVHSRYLLPTPRAQWRTAAAGPAVSLAAAGISVAAAAGLSALGAGQLAVLVFAAAALINVVRRGQPAAGSWAGWRANHRGPCLGAYGRPSPRGPRCGQDRASHRRRPRRRRAGGAGVGLHRRRCARADRLADDLRLQGRGAPGAADRRAGRPARAGHPAPLTGHGCPLMADGPGIP